MISRKFFGGKNFIQRLRIWKHQKKMDLVEGLNRLLNYDWGKTLHFQDNQKKVYI